MNLSIFPLFLYSASESGRNSVRPLSHGAGGTARRCGPLAGQPPPVLCTRAGRLVVLLSRGRVCGGRLGRVLSPRGKERAARSAMPRGPDSRLGPLAHLGHPVFAHSPPSPPTVTLPRNGAAVAWPPPHLPFWSRTPAQKKRITEERKVGSPWPAQGRALPTAPPVSAPASVNHGQLPASTSGPWPGA